jgi:hypothetical protein
VSKKVFAQGSLNVKLRQNSLGQSGAGASGTVQVKVKEYGPV